MAANTTPTPLDDEIAQLEKELRVDPKWLRLQSLRRIREQYQALPVLRLRLTDPTVHSNNGNGARRTGRKRSPERERAIQECTKWLGEKTLPTRLSDIDVHLKAVGINIGGTDPLNNLSALLSTCGQFKSHGRAGWTLLRGRQ